MAAGFSNLPAFFSTDADFRAWGSGISSLIAATGMVQTADTGQINWTTVLKPAAINTSQGYEIWRFADTLQATKPWFLKLEYGSAGVVDRPGIWVTVGTATNGAGTITTQTSVRRQAGASVSKVAGNLLPSYVSGSTDRLMLLLNHDAALATTPMWMVFDRTRDGSATTTGDGLFLAMGSSSATVANQASSIVIPSTGAVPAVASSLPVVWPNAGMNSAFGTDVGIGTCQLFIGKPYYSASLVGGNFNDLGVGTTFTASVLGGTRTYFPSATNTQNANGNSVTVSIAFLYE